MLTRQTGEPIDLFAATPKVQLQDHTRYNYDAALRNRFSTISEYDDPANALSAIRAQDRMTSQYQNALRSMQQRGIAGQGQDLANPVKAGSAYNPIGGRPSFGFGQHYNNPKLAAGAGTDSHRGLDWAVPVGTPIRSPLGGVVLSARAGNTGFGNEIRVEFDNGTYGIFGHLSGFNVKPGQRITPGMLMGASGRSGNVSGAHFHFEARTRLNDPSSAFDPSSWFGF